MEPRAPRVDVTKADCLGSLARGSLGEIFLGVRVIAVEEEGWDCEGAGVVVAVVEVEVVFSAAGGEDTAGAPRATDPLGFAPPCKCRP